MHLFSTVSRYLGRNETPRLTQYSPECGSFKPCKRMVPAYVLHIPSIRSNYCSIIWFKRVYHRFCHHIRNRKYHDSSGSNENYRRTSGFGFIYGAVKTFYERRSRFDWSLYILVPPRYRLLLAISFHPSNLCDCFGVVFCSRIR